jgi:prevent-host-death family protein
MCYSVYMAQIGMRELRHRLREYLARVEQGEAFEVTVFGRPVAQLRPVVGTQASLARLIADGRVTPPFNPDTSELPQTVMATTGTTATDALLAERRTDRR